jgi:hypothetical protein
MESFRKLIAVAAALRVLTLVAIPTSAVAGEYCRTDSSGMRGCAFTTLQQCLDMSSGRGGTCDRDPFYKDPNSALAYQPKDNYSHNGKTVGR